MIDVHTHAQLSEHWGCEWHDHWQPVYGHEWVDTTPEAYDEAMQGVDLALVFGIRATAVGMTSPHEYIADFCRRTKTNTIGFMALDPTDDDVLEQLADGVAHGLRGIKLYPVLALFDPRDERFDPFYRAVQEAGLILLWHMGATPSPVGKLEVSNPLVVDEVARRHPGITQIIAHMGHPWQRETIAVIRKNPRVFSDVSAAWARPADGRRALIRAQEWSVVDKLLFGSDYPIWTPAQAREGLLELHADKTPGLPPIADETVDWLLNGDPRRALGLA